MNRPNTEPRADIDILPLHYLIYWILLIERPNIVLSWAIWTSLTCYNSSLVSDYLDNIFSHGFLPAITKPTRISHTSATLIDHIYTNNITTGKSGIIITDVAYHFGTFHMTHKTVLRKQRKIEPGYFRIVIQTNLITCWNILIFNILWKVCLQMKHSMIFLIT